MALITPDFTDAVDFGPIPVGVYNTRIVKSELKTSQKHNQYVNWTLEVFGAEGDFEEYNGRKIWHTTMCSGKASGMLKTFVEAATGEDVPTNFDTDDLLSREIAVAVSIETGNDSVERNRIKSVTPLH